MASIDQVIAHIRFALDQLSAKNSHHEFEHVCRFLTRARICSNVLPATGPVSGGGDQGRDFETFRSYLAASPIAETSFAGLVSDKPLAFACTLQKKQIDKKIQSDVKTIMSSGSTVEGVHYFCSCDVPAAKRHKLQEWARATHSIELEIHDGQSISELLAGRDVFWIAERYLSVPSDIYPRSAVDDGGDWYKEQLEAWRKKDSTPRNHADFSAVKAAGRHAHSTAELRQDVPFWLRVMESFLDPGSDQLLRRRAIYEVAYLSLKGMGTLAGQEERLREYFSAVPTLEDPVDLEDASPMINYCAVVAHRGDSGLTVDEVSAWRSSLIDRVEERLRGPRTTNDLCLLLDLRGYLATSIDPKHPVRPQLEDALVWWNKLLDKVPGAPLYPLERLADHLTQFVAIFDEPPGYYQFTQRVDTLLAERAGEFVAAEKCMDRAEAFYKKRNLLAAVNQLHQSKVKWFAAETLQSSLRSMFLLSRCYSELGLQFAAKYYALAVAYMALLAKDSSLRPLSSSAVQRAAECDYLQGAWCGFMELIDIYLRAQATFVSDPHNLGKHKELQRAVLHVVIAKVITQKLAPEFSSYVDEKIAYWGIEDWVNDAQPPIQADWDGRSVPETWRLLGEQLGDVPFSDAGQVRTVSWSELGVIWTVAWRNDYLTTIAAEQFMAVMQIFLADLAGVDLCLLKTDVQIELDISGDAEMHITPLPSNAGRLWKISLPSPLDEGDAGPAEAQEHVFGAASAILYEISLTTEEAYHEALENAFREGLQSKINVIQSYGTVYRAFVPENVFDHPNRASKKKPVSPHRPKVPDNEVLGWLDGPGPGYSRERAERMLTARYEGSLPPIRLTLKRLKADPGFMSTVEKLRAEGWLDWHLLSAAANVAANYRFLQNPEALESEEEANRIYREIMESEEDEKSVSVPPEVFMEERLREAIALSMLFTLRLYGLESRQRTPDLKAMDHFLRHRYNYWTDDIEHDDPFIDESLSTAG